MHLNNEPFQLMKNGIKTIEIRLNDEKRQDIKSGDCIIFENLESKETLKVIVIETVVFTSFQSLLNKYSNKKKEVKSEDKFSKKKAAKYKINSQTNEKRKDQTSKL